jgi:glycosyltransferase involved in cell wall biosynthesis
MKKIKVFVDGHWFDDLYQSPCIFLKGLYGELLHDDRFEVYIGAVDVQQLKTVFNDSDKVTYLSYRAGSKYYRLTIDIPRILAKYKIDIAHYQYISPLFKTTKEIVTIHDILFKDHKHLFPWTYRITKDFLFKRSAKRADLVTTVSRYSADAILKHYKIPSEKIAIVPNGIADDFFVDYDNESLPDINKKYDLGSYLLYVSRIEPRKNHITLVKAYVELELWKKGVKLVLIGRTDIKVEALDTYISQLPVSIRDNILIFKNITFRELLSFYKNASIFVYPSLAEGFGIPPLEAAALKTRTLCSNTTALADYSFFGDDFFDPCDHQELARKIENKLIDGNIARREDIAERVSQSYNWKNISSGFASTILELFKHPTINHE